MRLGQCSKNHKWRAFESVFAEQLGNDSLVRGLELFVSNIVASFCEQSCCDITDLIVADSRDATQMTYHSMVHREGCPAIA